MKELLEKRIAELSQEIQALHSEREAMINRDREIEIRLHQLVGAIYEMQQLIAHLGHQPEADVTLVDPSAVEQAELEYQNSQRSPQISSETDDQSKEK